MDRIRGRGRVQRPEPHTEGAGRGQCAHRGPIHLGLDVHKDTISVAILAPDRDRPDVERVAHDEASVRRLVGRLGDPRLLRACYQAGPTGYELARLLHRIGVRCEVIAPSLIPKAPGDKARDRPSGLPAAGPAAPGRGTGRHPHPDRGRGGGAGSVPDPGRHGPGPHPGSASAGHVSARPRPTLAGRVCLDADPRALAASATLRGAGVGGDLEARLGGAARPRCSTGGDPGRPGRLVRPGVVRGCRAPPERLPGITRLGALTLASEDRGSSRQGGCLDALHAPHRGMVLPRRAGRRVLAYLRGLLGLSEAGSFLNDDAMLPGLQPMIGC
jgi:hypothetical protein